jgi:hypothetical protein
VFRRIGVAALNSRGYDLWSSHDCWQDISGQSYAMVHQHTDSSLIYEIMGTESL